MKIFANKNIWKKILIVFVLLTTVTFIKPEPVQAGWGGELMEPICDLLVGLADGFMNVTHHILIGQETTLIKVNLNDSFAGFARVAITAIVFLAVLAAAAAITAGGALAVGSVTGALSATAATGAGAGVLGVKGAIAVSAIIANIVPILVGSTYFGVKAYSNDAFDNEIALPLYSISPERIFSNTIPLFDVNFFNPSAEPYKYEWIHKTTIQEYAQQTMSANGKYVDLTDSEKALDLNFNEGTNVTEQLRNELKDLNITNGKQIQYDEKKYVQYHTKNGAADIVLTKRINEGENTSDETSSDQGETTAKGTAEKYSFSHDLSKIIKRWYYIIRTMAIVGMMSVLVYIGIRILISSTSEQKAKHKQLLGDWVVGMVLLFTMHYIMSFSNIAVDHLTELFSTINPMGQTALLADNNDKIENELKAYEIDVVRDKTEVTTDNNKMVYKYEEAGGDKYIEWNTDLMGRLRIDLQAYKKDKETYIGYTIMYIVLVIYTGIFMYTYIKRVIYMAFLTIISPLVALTYPIDKANDGSAQGFNYWFKEYIFNLLLQPLHLLIYTILVSTAIKLAASNMLYSLVAIGFIASAEKILRQMFNFSKASTPGIFAGPAGAALTMTGMRWLFGHGPRGGRDALSKGGSAKNSVAKDESGIISSEQNKVDVPDFMKGLFGDEAGDNSNNKSKIQPKQDENEKSSTLKSMREAEQENSLVPSGDELKMWDNDIRYEDGFEGMKYDEDEYENILRDGGWSEDDIAAQVGDSYRGPEPIEVHESEDNQPSEEVKKDNPETTDLSSDDNKLQHVRSIKNALGVTASAFGSGMKQKFVRKLENAQPARALGRFATGAIGAAAFGTLGVAAGVASGDAKYVGQYGAAGVAGGFKIGKDSYNTVDNALTVEGLDEVYQRAYLGEENYKKMIARNNQMKKAHEEETIRRIQQKEKISRKDAIDHAEQYAQKYMEYKINDVDAWIALNKMENKKIVKEDGTTGDRKYTTNEAIAAYKVHKRSGFDSKEKKKAVEKIQSDWNLNEKQAETYYRTAKVLDDIMNG